jgi:hypothetical protein
MSEKVSWTFLFQPYRQIEDSDLEFLSSFKFLTRNRRLITIEADDNDISSLEVDPDLWIYHKTSFTHFSGPQGFVVEEQGSTFYQDLWQQHEELNKNE